MSSVFLFAILIIAFARLRHRRRWWEHRAMGHGAYGPPWLHHPRRGPMMSAPGTATPPTPAPPRESAFELLKKRYVAGELSDEQYEREVDALLQTPEGRAQVQ